ncbi:hypothetical protein PUR28_08425 [Streptomyces sp. BE308]|uniref:hypothetical protein n=1 Tax=Streptomyces sp. BE308 TaxID=3002529 RepID=UPI002E7910DF|nr:hypothetical protein [Streptomyces sp. BE308]MEE1790800.1 hypothetical protein [Streptomyces sp. BE308]
MTETGGTHVSDPRGPVHSGSGDQYIVNQWLAGANERLIRSGTSRLGIVREHRRRLASYFVRPRGYGQAADRLTAPGAVVLVDGAPGIGRRTAATMLLEEASVHGGRVEELPLTWEEDTLDVSADDCYLLDLSNVTHADYPEAQQSLTRYRALVAQCGARLVAVPPVGLEWMLDPDLAPLVVRLERPRGRAVFSRYLRVRRVVFEPGQLDTDHLAHMFAAAPVRELARLADLVVQARDGNRYGTTFPDWRDEAVAAATNRSSEVAGHMRQHRGAPQRALLLTAAMNSGAASAAVLSATHCLLTVLKFEQDQTPRLAQADFGEQLEELDLERDGDGRVTFTRLAYDSAVRRHFWENFPDLRSNFREWVGQCVELPEFTAEDRARLIGRFAEQTLSTGRADDLCELIERWTQPAAGGRLRAEAAAALEMGLSHVQYGPRFRSRVYSWVTSGGIAPDLARVLTAVCQQVIAVTHPEQAMVRLRHLALGRGRTEGTAAAARSALLELARSNRRLYGRLIQRLLHGATTDGRGMDVLLALLDPVELRITPPRQEFTQAWRAVMTAPAADWTPVVRRWLAVLTWRRSGDQVLGALLAASAGDRELLNHLYVAACDWIDSPPVGMPLETRMRREDRCRTADRFCREIDLLQGVGPVFSGSDTRRTGKGI